jgi:uncharacterized membrane protein YvlD (DUF360 family)
MSPLLAIGLLKLMVKAQVRQIQTHGFSAIFGAAVSTIINTLIENKLENPKIRWNL